MKTETLLNIRSEVQKRIEISAKHALTEDPGTVKETDSFKSALMPQVDQYKHESSDINQGIEKTLPQDGSELPAKEIAADKNISSHKQSDIHELVNTHELSDIHEQGDTRELSNARQALLREVSYDLLIFAFKGADDEDQCSPPLAIPF